MTPDWNEHTYEQQFDSSLRRSPKSRPVPVTTNLRIMDETTAREVRIYAKAAAGTPEYILESCEEAPLQSGLRAVGRQYFTW
jgi:hypothetical protein